MMLPEHMLKSLARRQTLSVNSAIAKGIIPSDQEKLGNYRSLAEKLNAEAAMSKKTTSRQRRNMRHELRLREQAKKRHNTSGA
jgi:hypothetical protein